MPSEVLFLPTVLLWHAVEGEQRRAAALLQTRIVDEGRTRLGEVGKKIRGRVRSNRSAKNIRKGEACAEGGLRVVWVSFDVVEEDTVGTNV